MRILLVCRQLANHRTGNSLVCQDRGRGDKSGTLSIKLCQVNTNTSHCDGTLLTFEIFNIFAMHSENRCFKEHYGFEEGGGYDADLSWIDYDDLHLYSKEVHDHINYDIKCDFIAIVEI